MEGKEFEVKFWWLIFDEGRSNPDGLPEDEDVFELSSGHFLRLLEERVFGQHVQVQYEVHDRHVVAIVKGQLDDGLSQFMQRLFGTLSTWVINPD